MLSASAFGQYHDTLYENGKYEILSLNPARFGVRFGRISEEKIQTINPLMHVQSFNAKTGVRLRVRQIDTSESMTALIGHGYDWVASQPVGGRKFGLYDPSGELVGVPHERLRASPVFSFARDQPIFDVVQGKRNTVKSYVLSDGKATHDATTVFAAPIRRLLSSKAELIAVQENRVVRKARRSIEPLVVQDFDCQSKITCSTVNQDGEVVLGHSDGCLTIIPARARASPTLRILNSTVNALTHVGEAICVGLYDGRCVLIHNNRATVLVEPRDDDLYVPISDVKSTTDRLFIGSEDGSIICLELSSGKVLWTSPGNERYFR